MREIAERHPGLDDSRTVHELTRRLITRFVEDVITESAERLAGLDGLDAVRDAGRATIAFSRRIEESELEIKAFLWVHMYRHRDLVAIRERAAGVVRDLFLTFRETPRLMPEEWAGRAAIPFDHSGRRERLVCDYLAGMTDRYALAEHRRHFEATPDLRYGARLL